ncbi:MAG: sulfotransferase [Balneolaceae bacterium]|jgi:hypothetical protein
MSLSFLMCSERAGSNLITKILNAHSDICGPTTKHIVNPVARNLFRYEPIDEPGNWAVLLRDLNSLLNVDFALWESSFTVEKLSGMAPVGDIRMLVENIFYEEARQQDKNHVFVKENQVYEFLPFLMLHFPESKYVYQVRDPRDMALSWKKSPAHPGGVIKGARQWKKDQQQFLKNYNELRKRGKALHIKYENLIATTEEEIKRVLQFLGYAYEPEMMLFFTDSLTQKNAQQIKAWENLSKKVMSDNKKKYLIELSIEEISYIEKICGYEMCHLGYELENDLNNLEKISEEALDEFERYEGETIKCERSDGIKANMKAKREMYRRMPDEIIFS